jgi:hypothetical protein
VEGSITLLVSNWIGWLSEVERVRGKSLTAGIASADLAFGTVRYAMKLHDRTNDHGVDVWREGHLGLRAIEHEDKGAE